MHAQCENPQFVFNLLANTPPVWNNEIIKSFLLTLTEVRWIIAIKLLEVLVLITVF